MKHLELLKRKNTRAEEIRSRALAPITGAPEEEAERIYRSGAGN